MEEEIEREKVDGERGGTEGADRIASGRERTKGGSGGKIARLSYMEKEERREGKWLEVEREAVGE